MKRNLFFITLLCGGLAFAQTTGKVGIQTENPTETLDVKGTVRVQTLPKDGQKVSTPSANSNFKAAKTVVVDGNGVLGVVDGLPVTALPDTKVKTIQYVAKTVLINASTPTTSEIELGNLAVRYNGTSEHAGATQPISFKLVNDITDLDGNHATADNVICNVQKVGSGGAGFGGQQTFFSAYRYQWYDINKKNDLIPNLNNNDFAVYNILLLNTREVYRLTVSLNTPIVDRNINGTDFVRSAAQVTLFLERLTNHEEKVSK